MIATLREVLELPEARHGTSTAQADEFGKAFREGIASLNQEMQVVAAQASREEHATLETQRTRLYEAFQKALKVIDPTDPKVATSAIERVKAATTAVEGKAAAVASGVSAARDQWLVNEADFDNAVQNIGELEEVQHSKAKTLRQLSDAIRERVAGRKYQESLTLLDQLLPKLARIHSEHLQQANGHGNGVQESEEGLSPQDREAMWKELEEIERRLELLLAEHQITL